MNYPIYPTEQNKAWVVGFAYDDHRILLIKKNRPDWQSGLLNGVGGKIESGETPLEAMVREFSEETGLDTEPTDWKSLVKMTFPAGTIWFFANKTAPHFVEGARSTTDEEVVVKKLNEVMEPYNRADYIPNLSWLIPLAVYRADEYEPIEVKAYHDSTI